MHYFMYEEVRAGCFAFIVLWMPCYCKCPVALPLGAVAGSEACNCGIPDHTHVLFVS